MAHLGVAGYWQQQVTDDRGPGGAIPSERRVVGVGPEISTFCPAMKLFLSARYAYEFAARDQFEGHKVVVTLIKGF